MANYLFNIAKLSDSHTMKILVSDDLTSLEFLLALIVYPYLLSTCLWPRDAPKFWAETKNTRCSRKTK